MAPFISLLPVRKDKRLGAAPTQLQAPRLASPPPIEFDRFFPPSPAPPPSSKHPNLPQQDVDLSVLDFSDLLGDSRVNALEMLNDESFGFLGPDETLATVAGAQLDDESDMEEVHDELETVEEQKAPEPIVVEPTPAPSPPKKPAAKSRSSLAPLRAVAVQVPLPPSSPPPSLPAPAPKQSTAPVPKRPRASLPRPSHILPRGHPSHPRHSIAFALPPPIVEVQEETVKDMSPPSKVAEPKRSALKKSSSGSDQHNAEVAHPPRSSSLAVPTLAPPTHATVQHLLAPTTANSPPLLATASAHEHEHDPFPSPSIGLVFDGDSSLPSIGVPLDLMGVTSTPARPGWGFKPSTSAVPIAEEESPEPIAGSPVQVQPIDKDSSRPRRATMAVTFALPDLEESLLAVQPEDVEHLSVETAEQPSTSTTEPTAPLAKLKRRASRVSETFNAPSAPRPPLAFSTSRRASRAFASAPPNISSTPGTSLQPTLELESATLRLSSSLPPPLPHNEPPRTVIRLTASASSKTPRPRPSTASRPPPSAAPITASVLIPAQPQVAGPAPPAPAPTTRATGTSAGLTLPRDFDFLNRGAEREAERKKRTEQRERERRSKEQEEAEKRKRKATSAWAATSTKDPSKVKDTPTEDEQLAKRAKLSASLSPGWPTGKRRASTLHSSAPAPRQPRSRPSHLFSSARRRSTALSVEPTADSSTALTKEALEASAVVQACKVDLKRRVSTYLEGVLPGVLEEDEDYAEEERMVEEASRSAVAIEILHTVDEAMVAAPSASGPPAAVVSAPVLKQSADPARAPSAARRPLAPSDSHNKRKPTIVNAALPPAGKPTTKVQPFTFGSTTHHSRGPTAPLATASPVFVESLSAWKSREAAAASLGAPPKMSSLGGGAKRGASRAPRAPKPRSMTVLADSQSAVEVKRRKVAPAMAPRGEKAPLVKTSTASESKETMWARTEQRRVEREAWEKKQREREEEVRRHKEQQRKEEAEQERLKLKALRDALVIHPHPIPASTYERRVAKRA